MHVFLQIVIIAMALSIVFRKHQDDEEDENDPNNAQAAADEILENEDEVENIGLCTVTIYIN